MDLTESDIRLWMFWLGLDYILNRGAVAGSLAAAPDGGGAGGGRPTAVAAALAAGGDQPDEFATHRARSADVTARPAF